MPASDGVGIADLAAPRLRLIGGASVCSGAGELGLSGSQPRLVLAFLVLKRHRGVTRDELSELLWPEAMPRHWAGALRGVMTQVRRFLVSAGAASDAAVIFDDGQYRLRLAPDLEIDVELAQHDLARAEVRLASGSLTDALATASQAADLLEAPLLGADRSPWLDDERRSLAYRRIRALHISSIACAGIGDFESSVALSEDALRIDRLDEGSHRAVMAAHLAAGSPAGALRAYEHCRQILLDQLGCRPGPGTEALYQRALHEGPCETGERTSRARPTSPSEASSSSADSQLAASTAARVLGSGRGARAGLARWAVGRRAGDRAMADLDYASAVTCYQRALDDGGAPPRDAARLEAALGNALRRCGQFAAARAALGGALVRLRSVGDAEGAALAILELVGGGGRGVSPELDDADRAELLAEALDGLGAGPPSLRIQVMAELSLALLLVDPTRSKVIARAVEDLARATGRPGDVAMAMVAGRLGCMLPAAASDRLRSIDALLARGAGELSSELLARVLLWRQYDLAEMGDRPGFDHNLAQLRELTDELGQPYWRWVAAGWRVTEAMVDGDHDLAAERATATLGVMGTSRHPEIADAWSAHLLGIEVARGRAGSLVEEVRAAAEERPNILAYRAALALGLAQGGRAAEAAEVLDRFCGPAALAVPEDTNWSGTVATLAAAAHGCAHRELAASLVPALERHAQRMVVLSLYGGGALYLGPIALHLGRLLALLGRPVEARRHLVEAEARAVAFGSAGYAQHARAALLDLGRPGR